MAGAAVDRLAGLIRRAYAAASHECEDVAREFQTLSG